MPTDERPQERRCRCPHCERVSPLRAAALALVHFGGGRRKYTTACPRCDRTFEVPPRAAINLLVGVPLRVQPATF